MTGSADRPAGRGVLAAPCVSTLVVNANTSAVTILLPSISTDVDAPVAQLQWAVTGYSLVGGRGDRHRRRARRRLRAPQGLPGRARAVHRLVRADRALDQRRRRGRRA